MDRKTELKPELSDINVASHGHLWVSAFGKDARHRTQVRAMVKPSRSLVHERDSSHGATFSRRVHRLGIIKAPPRPNVVVER